MNIGLFGGTFNPVHAGHLHLATEVHRMLELDRIILIPTGDPPHKPSGLLAPSAHRMEMINLAIESYAFCEVSDFETQKKGISYSIDTVRHFKDEYPDPATLGFIIGLDAFLEFQTWKHTDQLLELCDFIVCARPNTSFTELRGLSFFPNISPNELEQLDQQTIDRMDVRLDTGTRLRLLAIAPCDISASGIREGLAKGNPPKDWLPASVYSYIIQHQLYL